MKKKNLRRLFCLALTLTLAVSLLATTVLADTSDDFEYSISDGKATVTAYTGSSASVTIPSSLGGCPVTWIGSGAFEDRSGLTSVTIPSGVTVIASDAFSGCSDLTSITIPESMTSIGNSAFSGCSSLTGVTIPGRTTDIGDYAFSNCSGLTSITIPDSVTDIGDYAFSYCSALKSVTIGSGLANISNHMFAGCRSLKQVTIPEGVAIIGAFAFNACTSLADVTLPDSLSRIDAAAFQDCSALTEFTIPDSVTSIGTAAFNLCSSLTSIAIPAGVTKIGNWAFGQCSSLTGITVAAENQNYCAVDGVLFSFDLKTLQAFPAGKSGVYTIPDGVTDVQSNAFSGCKGLTSVTIPDSMTSIGNNAFSGCISLENIFVAAGNLSYCDIEGVLFNANGKILQIYPAGKGSDYVIPSGVTSIGANAFNGCGSLTSITIPNSVNYIGEGAFINSALTDVYFYGTQAQWEAIEIEEDNDSLLSATIHFVPLSIRYSAKTILIGTPFQFTATGGSGSYTWRTGNSSVATVDSTGKVTGKTVGNTYLYCKDSSGTEVRCYLEVRDPLSIRYSAKTILIGTPFQFEAKGGSGGYTWRTGNSSVATVDSAGKVTGKAVGNTYLYCKDSAGTEVKCLLKVVDPLSIRYSEKTVNVGSTFQFTATGGSGTYTWRVGNSGAATVDSTGKVTGVAVGNTYLYCKDSYGTEVRCLLKVIAG